LPTEMCTPTCSLRTMLKERFDIAHTTIQLEEEGLEEAERHA